MKILNLSYEFPPLGGGGAKVVQGLSCELIKRNHAIDLVTMGFLGLPMREEVNGIRVRRVPCIRINQSMCYAPEMIPYLILALPFMLYLAKKNHYDLNHTHFIFPDGILAYLLKKITGLPYIITAHGSDVPGYNPNRFIRLHKILSPLWRRIVLEADMIVCPSKSIEALILYSR